MQSNLVCYFPSDLYSNINLTIREMSFFSWGIHGRGKNRGRGRNNFWSNKRPRISIHFDDDSDELNKLLQTSFLNLVGQGDFHPYPQHEIPPYKPHPKILNIHVPTHVSLQREVPVNDG